MEKPCITFSGTYSPRDFTIEINRIFILHLLMTNRFAIDFVDNYDYKFAFIRPLRIDENPISPYIYFGVCVNYKNAQCILTEENKPRQCKGFADASNNKIIQEWALYQNDLLFAINLYPTVKNKLSDFYKNSTDIYVDVYEKMKIIEKFLKKYKWI